MSAASGSQSVGSSTPTVEAIRATGDSPAASGARSMKAAACDRLSLARVTTSMAVRDLPTPPAPTSVTSAPFRTSASRSATSRSRPISWVACRGSFSPRPLRAAGRRDALVSSSTRSVSEAPSAPASNATVSACGDLRKPRSSALTASTLTQARSASACWVSPAATRSRRSAAPKSELAVPCRRIP